MIKTELQRDITWENLEHGVISEDFNFKFKIFGVRLFKREVRVNHDMDKVKNEKHKVGFKND